MNKTLQEWIAKAEGDFCTAQRESQAADYPNYDAVCFHAQQCVEKLLKAVLIQRQVLAPKTHDLLQLHLLVRANVSSWRANLRSLEALSRGAVAYRYPGEKASKAQATRSLGACRRLRLALHQLLGYTPPKR